MDTIGTDIGSPLIHFNLAHILKSFLIVILASGNTMELDVAEIHLDAKLQKCLRKLKKTCQAIQIGWKLSGLSVEF